MRKIIFSVLTINLISFSFQKLEFKEIKDIKVKSRNHFIQTISLANIPGCFDSSTGFWLTTSPLERNLVQSHYKYIHFGQYNSMEDLEHIICQDGKDPIADFLKCNFDYDSNTFWEIDNLKQYESITSGRCTGPILFGKSNMRWGTINKSLNNPNYITFYSQDVVNKYPLYYDHKQLDIYDDMFLYEDILKTIKLRKQYYIPFRKIDVIHKDNKVFLRKKDSNDKILQEIELQSTLLNYYKPSDNYTNLAQKLAADKNKYSDLSGISANTVYTANQLNYPPFPKEQYQFLKDSQILTLWHVSIKPEKGSQPAIITKTPKIFPISILIGLAQNKKTKDLFHWIIDLKRDINVLFDGLFATNTGLRNQKIMKSNNGFYRYLPYSDKSCLIYWYGNTKLHDNYMIDFKTSRVVQFKGSNLYYTKHTFPVPSHVIYNSYDDIAKLNWCILSDALDQKASLNSNDINELKTSYNEPLELQEGYIYWKKFSEKYNSSNLFFQLQ